MDLCLITPIQQLECTRLLPGRFCIAPIAARNETYRRFFTAEAVKGYSVILDNGVFENDILTDAEYIELAQKIGAKIVIVPDQIGSEAGGNLKRGYAFIGHATPKLAVQTEYMFVPQCSRNHDDDFKTVLTTAISLPEFKWIGICRDAIYNAFGQYTHTEDQELNRFFFSVWFEKSGLLGTALANGKKFHFLGMGGNLRLSEHYWYVSSMDTASLFFLSSLGITATEDGYLHDKIKRPADYFIRDFSYLDWDILKHNCLEAQRWASKAQIKRNQIEGWRL